VIPQPPHAVSHQANEIIAIGAGGGDTVAGGILLTGSISRPCARRKASSLRPARFGMMMRGFELCAGGVGQDRLRATFIDQAR